MVAGGRQVTAKASPATESMQGKHTGPEGKQTETHGQGRRGSPVLGKVLHGTDTGIRVVRKRARGAATLAVVARFTAGALSAVLEPASKGCVSRLTDTQQAGMH